jgi:isoprenylcysteine carboxyl methyltransferase (ICMT) family protein YpbQ
MLILLDHHEYRVHFFPNRLDTPNHFLIIAVEYGKIKGLCHNYNTTMLGITPFKLTILTVLGYSEIKSLRVNAAFWT